MIRKHFHLTKEQIDFLGTTGVNSAEYIRSLIDAARNKEDNLKNLNRISEELWGNWFKSKYKPSSTLEEGLKALEIVVGLIGRGKI